MLDFLARTNATTIDGSDTSLSGYDREPSCRSQNFATVASNDGLAAFNCEWLSIFFLPGCFHDLHIPDRNRERARISHECLFATIDGDTWHRICKCLHRFQLQAAKISKIEKVFDVACTLIDVMSCVPIDSANFELGPLDYLTRLINLMFTLRGGGSRYVPLVIAKIQETLPAIAPSIIHSIDLRIPNDHPRNTKSKRSSSNSSTSSPFSTPPFMHYYPLA